MLKAKQISVATALTHNALTDNACLVTFGSVQNGMKQVASSIAN